MVTIKEYRAHLTVARIEKVVGLKAKDWAGRCHEIACAVAEKMVPGGEAVYGHWLGDISLDSPTFGDRRHLGFCRHGWIEVTDGRRTIVIDPTRWAFEAVEPYIFVGRKGKEYDRGGNRLRAAMTRPPPVPSPGDKRTSDRDVAAKLPAATMRWLDSVLEDRDAVQGLTLPQMAWVGNLPVQTLGGHAGPIFRWLEAVGQGAIIPWDNRVLVLGPPRKEARP